MRRSRRPGAILYIMLLFLLVTFALAGIVVDMGGALMTKQQAITAAELAGVEGLSEIYAPEYQAIGNIPNANAWPGLVRQTESRTSARNRAAQHEVGYEIQLLDRDGNPVAPGDPDLIVHFGPSNTHFPSLELNLANQTAGDQLLGRWEKVPGGDYRFVPTLGGGQPGGFQNLPTSMQVVVRRTDSGAVPGVSQGDNPIPFLFRRAAWTGESGVDPGVYRNRGERLEVVHTVSMLPSGTIGEGSVVPYQIGLARAGVAPLVIVMRPGNDPVRNWFIANDPNVVLTANVDNQNSNATTVFFTDYGLGGNLDNNVRDMIRFLANGAGQQLPPPSVSLDQQVPFGNVNEVQRLVDLVALEQSVWTVPVVLRLGPPGGGGKGKGKGGGGGGGNPDFRVVGFARLYCADVDQANAEIDLRLAPSAVPRNGIPLRSTVPAAIANEFFGTFWQTVDGQRVGPRPFGVACSAVTVRYGHVGGR